MTWLGIPYERADCVRITRLVLRARGVRSRDPRTHPEAWRPCARAEALAVTYRDRSHIAPLLDGYALEARRGRSSKLVPIDRLPATDLEFWRPA